MGVSLLLGKDLVNKIGYKNGLALGLVISALGTLLFYPAANTGSYPLMLAGLFTVGLGFSLQSSRRLRPQRNGVRLSHHRAYGSRTRRFAK